MEGEAVKVSELELHSLLIKTGINLLDPSPSVDQLLAVLDNIEELLGFLGQDPSPALKDALLPAAKGLVSDRLFRHPDMNVKASVLSCIHEIIRITAPTAPYEQDTMKKIFQQTLSVLGKLSLLSGHCYDKAWHILETFAKFKSCLILLDLGCDELIIQMFQIFLDTIGSTHPDAIISKMEEIITMLIEESDEITLDLLKPLLTSVTKENQNISPLSWRLGAKVLQNSSAKVKPYLTKTVEKMRADIQYYTDIMASIWPDAPAEVKLMVMKAGTDASDPVPVQGEGTQPYESSLPDGNSSKTQVCREQVEQQQFIAREPVQPEGLKSGEGLPEKASGEILPRIKGRKPEEGGCATSSEVSRKRKNISVEESPLPNTVSMDQTSPKRHQAKKKKTLKNALGQKENFPSDSAMKDKRTTQECLDGEYWSDEKSRAANEYREELIDARVKVWWPEDRKFYKGVVESYDPLQKKHKILYVDGDVEILRLKRERWLLLDHISNRQDQEANLPSSSVSPAKLEKEKLSSDSGSKKKDDGSSSERSRSPTESKSHGKKPVASSTRGILGMETELDATKEGNGERPLIRYVRRKHTL